ncbi:hypothetical protein OUZ56_004132 [Daphnia magna]|uniref:Uncharacterized protein n=1 Tax=Daphnia magna TaxID=35525 RepID=A0ABQ9YNU2_9CRUS|nr:hypothetical protein OUZ56_004132 [Daphnia magna]
MAFDYGAYGRSSSSPTDDELDYHYGLSLEEWARDKPLSILQLDPADRAVLRIAGRKYPGGKTCQKALHLRVVMATDTGAWDFYDRNESRGDQMAAHLRLLYRCVLTVI